MGKPLLNSCHASGECANAHFFRKTLKVSIFLIKTRKKIIFSKTGLNRFNRFGLVSAVYYYYMYIYTTIKILKS